MSLWHIAWGYLWNRKLTTVLTIVSVALAVGLISSVLSLRKQLERRFEDDQQAFDLVVGPKGSPLQLVLGSVYFLDSAIGRVSLEDYEKIKAQSDSVVAAFPIGLGDTYGGFRIVGTIPELLDHKWKNSRGEVRMPFKMDEGRKFEKPMEAVVGGVAARQLGLNLGDTFESVHGMFQLSEDLREFDHAAHPYTVVGILETSGTPFDRAIYCDIQSIWDAHSRHGEAPPEHVAADAASGHEEKGGDAGETEPEELSDANSVSAVLIQLQGPSERWTYEEWINDNTNAMAAVPIQVISNFFKDFLDPIKGLMMGVGYLVVIISALSILIGLYLSIIQRRRDLAIMRALGASSYEIFGAVIIEAFWVTVLGIGVGWVFGNVVTLVLGFKLARDYGFVVTPFSLPSGEEYRAFATVALVGLVAGILPAWQAYRTDVAQDLADRQ